MSLSRMIGRSMRCVRHHGRILFQGFTRMLFGTATAGCFAIAGYGFITIPAEDGYIAVMAFICAMLTLVVAMSSMYVMGGGRKKRSR